MNKRERKHRKWLITKQKKRMRQLRRKNKKKGCCSKANTHTIVKEKSSMYVKAPKHFSIFENPNETIDFFSKTFAQINQCKRNSELVFDLGEIETVTTDAIMYLIAIINNTKRLRIMEVNCRGNLPDNDVARKQFERVGFYNYVNSFHKKTQTQDPDRIRILHGTESNSEITANICDFVNSKSNSEGRMLTKRLYPMLVELMTNVKQHAYYNHISTMYANWYIYVENCDTDVKFVFLDTGQGIPSTIQKKWSETIKNKVGLLNGGDAYYIAAALEGEFRTETKLEHRGKGLPEIYKACTSKESRINHLSIISGKGYCYVDDDNQIVKKVFSEQFEGTLFTWSFKKEVA